MKGGSWDDFVQWLKDSKIVSKVGSVLLPAAGGALAGLFTANPLGLAAGAAAGEAGAEWLKSQGFGRCRCGGASGLAISPPGTRLGQHGMGKVKGGSVLAMPRAALGTAGMMGGRRRRKGKGIGEFNTISSSFGQVSF